MIVTFSLSPWHTPPPPLWGFSTHDHCDILWAYLCLLHCIRFSRLRKPLQRSEYHRRIRTFIISPSPRCIAPETSIMQDHFHSGHTSNPPVLQCADDADSPCGHKGQASQSPAWSPVRCDAMQLQYTKNSYQSFLHFSNLPFIRYHGRCARWWTARAYQILQCVGIPLFLRLQPFGVPSFPFW